MAMNDKNSRGFSEQTIRRISEIKNEPLWMKEKRLANWLLFERNPVPKGTDESWRRTDISPLRLEGIIPFHNNHLSHARCQLPDASVSENMLVQEDSTVIYKNLSKALEERGVIYTDLDLALIKYPDMVKEYFMTNCVCAGYDIFTPLHLACWSGGAFLYVPKGLEITIPFRAIYSINTPGTGIFQHTLIILEQSSKVAFSEELRSDYNNPQSEPHDSQSLSCGVTEIYLKEGAQLEYFALQDFGMDTYYFGTKRALVDRDGSINWIEGSIGSKLAKSYLEARLKGSGSSCKLLGASFVNNNQHLDISTSMDHIAPNTRGDIYIKGAVDDKARSVFQGMIRIDRSAQQTDSYMGNHNLVLSEKARADSIPALEIEADNVKASHGVTVGQVDEEQLFYLMSRGLPKDDAKDMIVDGFFESLFDRIPQRYAQDAFRNLIGKKRGRCQV